MVARQEKPLCGHQDLIQTDDFLPSASPASLATSSLSSRLPTFSNTATTGSLKMQSYWQFPGQTPRTTAFQMYEKNVNQPDIGATSISALIISGFSFNFSATATNYLQIGFALFKRSDSNSNDGESGKPAAAASKSLFTSLLPNLLASSRGLSPVLMV